MCSHAHCVGPTNSNVVGKLKEKGNISPSTLCYFTLYEKKKLTLAELYILAPTPFQDPILIVRAFAIFSLLNIRY